VNFGQAIYSLLDSSMSTAVGGDIYPNKAPQSATIPYIVYTITGTEPQNSKDVTASSQIVDIQVDVMASTYAKSSDLAKQARTALERQTFSNQEIIVDDIAYVGASANFQEEQEIQRYIVEFSMFVKEK